MVELERDGYFLSDDKARVQHDVVHRFLTSSYWATGRSLETVRRSCDGALCFGIYRAGDQVGFCRVVTDHATFAWIADVFVLPEHRGRGLATWMLQSILQDERLAGLKRWMLGTRDAHPLYESLGFVALSAPERFMEIRDVHASATGG